METKTGYFKFLFDRSPKPAIARHFWNDNGTLKAIDLVEGQICTLPVDLIQELTRKDIVHNDIENDCEVKKQRFEFVEKEE